MEQGPAAGKDEHPEPDEPTEQPSPPPRRWLVATFVLILVLLASLVTGVVHVRSVLHYRATADRRDVIMSVARNVAELSYSLDYESFPQQVTKIAAATTGEYRKGLVDGTKGLQYLLSEGRVKSTCTITAAGIEREDGNTATVLLSVTTLVTNTEVQQPKVRHYRVAIGLVRQDTQWFVQSNDVIA